MPRTFAYVRVSTVDQTTENQIEEIRAAGFAVEPHRMITETVSGSVPITQRKEFSRLLDRLEAGDVLVVSKLDRLGRDAIDVSQTVHRLEQMGVKVHCLALGGIDLASSAGKMTMGVINVMAQFERDLLIERTTAGVQRAKAQGRILGRPPVLDDRTQEAIREGLKRGAAVAALAREHKTSRQTIMRIRDRMESEPDGHAESVPLGHSKSNDKS